MLCGVARRRGAKGQEHSPFQRPLGRGEWGGCETGPFPSFSRRGGCAINKKIPFLCGADGVVSNFKQKYGALREHIRRLRDLLLTTPSAPVRNGIFLLRRSHPSLKTEGIELASTCVIDFEIACITQSPEIRSLIINFHLSSGGLLIPSRCAARRAATTRRSRWKRAAFGKDLHVLERLRK